MCLSPIKICGTVRRPLRATISVRASGRASTSISSKSTFFFSAAGAPVRNTGTSRWHTSEPSVASGALALARRILRQWQVLRAPGSQPAAQIEGLRKALGRELPARGGAQGAGVVVDHDDFFLVFLQRVGAFEDLLARHLAGPRDMAGRELLLAAQIDEQRSLVHQADEVLG